MEFVQGVLDFIGSYWDAIAAKQTRVYGIAPERVEALPIRTIHGEFAGGYFPLAYDDRLDATAAAHADLEASGLQRLAAYAQATTKRNHTKARRESVKRKVRLDFGVIYQHVNQVIHDLSHHEMLIDVGRLLGHPAVQRAIYDTHGDLVYKQFREGVRDVAMGEVPAIKAHEQAANHIRKGATIAAMGWSFTTAAVQPLGLTQSIERIGAKWVGRGLSRFLRDAATMENTSAWINERSKLMANRGRTQQRELNEIRNSIGVNTGKFTGWVDEVMATVTADTLTRQGMVDSYFYGILVMQRLVDIPTWLGQYEKSMAGGKAEADAIAEADQAVLDSQGGGQVKDLAGVQRGGSMLRLWTTFYSFFNVTYNQTVERNRQARYNEPGSIGRLGVSYLLLYIIPAVLGYTLRHGLPDDDDELNAWPKEIGLETIAYGLGTMVGLREIGGAVQGFREYGGPGGARAFAGMNRLIVQTGQIVESGFDPDKFDAPFWRALGDTSGTLFHFPTAQTRRTIEGIAALIEGETVNPLVVLTGPDR
jgi:hypothetical protein